MKKVCLIILIVLSAACLITVNLLFLNSKNDNEKPQCSIEKVEKYNIRDVSYNFKKLDEMTKKYEIKVNYLKSFILDGEKMEDNEEYYFYTSDDNFVNNVKENSEQYGVYEVTVKINNTTNGYMNCINFSVEDEKNIVVAADFKVEADNVKEKSEETFYIVVLTNETEEQVKKLLISSGLKVGYETGDNLNVSHEVYIDK